MSKICWSFAAMMLVATAFRPASAEVINEFVLNHTGTDTREFVEVLGAPDEDLSNFWLLQVEGDVSVAGVIDSVFRLGMADSGGFWTTGFQVNEFENGTLTLLLVTSFTGMEGDDLDTNNDGTFDSTPWSSIRDSVAVSDGGAGDQTYSPVVLAPGFGGDPFTPGGASRIPNGLDTDRLEDFALNDFEGAGLPGFVGNLEPGEVANTPGAANAGVANAVPEPSGLMLLGLGAAGLLGYGWRRNRADARSSSIG